MRILICHFQGNDQKHEIKADWSSGACNAIKKYFNTKEVYHIKGSLWEERKAEFSVDGKLLKVQEIKK